MSLRVIYIKHVKAAAQVTLRGTLRVRLRLRRRRRLRLRLRLLG